MPQTQVQQPRRIYLQMTTKNKSFLDMHHYLKSIGIKNNAFMLVLLDPDLDGIDPHDPHLNAFYKQKVLRECCANFWYFLREVVLVPSPGGASMRYKLTRGNLALNFCMALNLNVFYEAPRQQGKTVSVAIKLLHTYNFGTSNAKIAFLHKGMEGAKDNLLTLKNIRDLLPPYLIMKERILPDGRIDRGKDNATEIMNPFNHNSVKTFASATNRMRAASLLRGKTIQIIWYDEYGFLPYNDIIYMNAAPAFKTASMFAKQNGSPYGIVITTTPGFMSTNEGKEAYTVKETATKFSETWYDLTYQQLRQILDTNIKSDFVYIRFTYQELGCSEEWFNEVCKLLKNSWPDIRREILLEWSTGVENSPFKEEDLNTIGTMVRPPISETYLLGKYRFETYLQADTRSYPPIMGVDVSAGYKQDSSTITIIDSRTTKVLGCLNCNYISPFDLAKCIEFIIKNWLPNCICCVERNGGYGASVISKLIKAGLKKNLYYEIKDVVVEERQDGIHAYKQKIRTKVFGINSTKAVRSELIDILLDRVENHKDKFMSPIIYNELLGMEIKRNGKIEHSDSTHDDQVFSYLMALAVWYNGTNLAERYGIKKTSIKTDEDVDEKLNFDDDTVEIVSSFNEETEQDEEINMTLEAAIKAGGKSMADFIKEREEYDKKQFQSLVMNNPVAEKAYREMYGIPKGQPIFQYVGADGSNVSIPDDVFNSFYQEPKINTRFYDDGFNNPHRSATVPFSRIGELEDEDYNIMDHFNF